MISLRLEKIIGGNYLDSTSCVQSHQPFCLFTFSPSSSPLMQSARCPFPHFHGKISNRFFVSASQTSLGRALRELWLLWAKVWLKWEVCTKRDRRRVIRPAPRVNLLSRGLVCLLATRRPEKTIRSCFPSPSSNPIMSRQEQQTDKAKELCQSCSEAGRELLIKGTQDGRVLVSKPQPELMPGRCMPLWTNEGATSARVYQTHRFWEVNNTTQ